MTIADGGVDLAQPLAIVALEEQRPGPPVIARASGTGAMISGTIPRSDCSAASRAIVRSRSSRRGGSSRDDRCAR